jgi:hypothetical protein
MLGIPSELDSIGAAGMIPTVVIKEPMSNMFWKKEKKKVVISTTKSDEEVTELPSCLEKSAIDWAAFRPHTHVAVKIWLPERLDERLRQIADHQFSSRSALIRNALFIYVYGAYVYLQMRQDSDGFYYHDDSRGNTLFSRSKSRTPQLGKNSINFKVWLPEALKNDLKLLADQGKRPVNPSFQYQQLP